MKKGFLGFGKKPARVSVEPINEKIVHEADQNTVKVAPDAVKQLDDFVASPKDETIAFNKVTKLVTVSDNKEIAQENLKQPVCLQRPLVKSCQIRNRSNQRQQLFAIC